MRLSTTRCWVKLEAAGKKKGSLTLLHKSFSSATINTRLVLLLLAFYSPQLLPHKTFQVPKQEFMGIKTH